MGLLKIGFTGTRKGMSDSQKEVFKDHISDIDWSFDGVLFIHGDCIGADVDAHLIAKENKCIIHKRPCYYKNQRAFCDGGIIVAEPVAPLERNRLIVKDCDTLLACPKGFKEELRSGTWATIRYARKANKTIYIIFPDGTVRCEYGESF